MIARRWDAEKQKKSQMYYFLFQCLPDEKEELLERERELARQSVLARTEGESLGQLGEEERGFNAN